MAHPAKRGYYTAIVDTEYIWTLLAATSLIIQGVRGGLRADMERIDKAPDWDGISFRGTKYHPNRERKSV
jgi:hypothetical protein